MILLFPFYREEIWGMGELGDFRKITQAKGGRTGISTQSLISQPLCDSLRENNNGQI